MHFCGSVTPVDALSPQERISADSYSKLRSGVNPFTGLALSKDNHILVDVREKVQFELCSIDGSVNIPFSAVSSTPSVNAEDTEWVSQLKKTEKPILVVCRLGNDSQVTVRKMKELGLDFQGRRFVGDVRGGLRAWRDKVDADFPDY